MKFRNLIREYFTFSRNERIGLYVLIILIILLGIANKVIFYFEKPGQADWLEFERLKSAFEKTIDENDEGDFKILFSFDPNSIDSLALDSLDMPMQIKINLLKYRAKGGSFFQKDDLKKLYGMTDSIYMQLQRYIRIAPAKKQLEIPVPEIITPPKFMKTGKKSNKKEKEKIELNGANESDLKSLYGIGEVLSVRIIKYRNLLGGFNHLGQLREVYGMPEETYLSILPSLKIDTNRINKLNVNFAGEKELAKHPYLSWQDAQKITEFRSKDGFIKQLSILNEEKVLNDSLYVRILPYLKTKNE